MADNDVLTNGKTTFDADTNPDISVRSTEKLTKKVQHVIIDWGGTGAEDTSAPDFATQTTLAAILTAIGTPTSATLPTAPTYAQVSVGDATPTDALAASVTRKKAFLINNTSETFWIRENADAEQGKYFSIGPGQFYTVLSTKRVSVIKSSGGALNIDTVDVA